MRRLICSALLVALMWDGPSVASPQSAEAPAAGTWVRLEALPAEMQMTPRESFDGVPTRFALLTDGSVFVGGRREVLRGALSRSEMQEISTQIDLALRALGKTPLPPTLSLSEGPATFRFSIVSGTPMQIVLSGDFPSSPPPKSPTATLVEFIRRLATFRHPSLKPWDADRFLMLVRERTLVGGCRTARGLPALAPGVETVVPASVTHGFPTGADYTQICDAGKRFAVIFRPLVPGER